MRRREYLHAATGAIGLAGLTSTATSAAGNDDESPSARFLESHAGTGSDQDEFDPLGRVDVSNDISERYQATEVVTTHDGSHAFISRFDGFGVVDIADPGEPEILHTATELLEDEAEETLTGILDLKYNRDRLIVAAGTSRGFQGFAVYDVSDPADPALSTFYETLRPIHNCHLYGRYAFLTARTSVEIIDLAPTDPELVEEWTVTDVDEGFESVPGQIRIVHDVYVQDDLLYVANWDAGTWIVDVSDPTDATAVGHVGGRSPEELEDAPSYASAAPPGNDHYAQPSDDGSLLVVGAEAWAVRTTDEDGETELIGGPGGIRIYDIEDVSEPTELASIDPAPVPEGENATRQGYWTTSHNFDVVGDSLYTSWYRGGVKVHDISDPENPEEVASWADGDDTMFWAARAAVPGDFFVGSSMADPDGDGPGGLYTFPDPTDPDVAITPRGPEPMTLTTTAADSSAPTETQSPTPTRSPTPTETLTRSPSAGEEEAKTGEGEEEMATGGNEEMVTGGDAHGFGPLAALGALGIGAWRFVRDDQ